MKKMILLSTLLTLLAANRAEAANVAVITTPPGILNVLILIIACAGVVVGFQVLTVVRGGLLSRSWQLFIGGFAVLVLAQVFGLLYRMQIMILPEWIISALLVVMAGIFLYGAYEARRVLG